MPSGVYVRTAENIKNLRKINIGRKHTQKWKDSARKRAKGNKYRKGKSN